MEKGPGMGREGGLESIKERYDGIVRTIDRFFEKFGSSEAANQIKINLLQAAKKVISSDDDDTTIKKKLDQIKNDILIFLQTLEENPEQINEFVDITLNSFEGSELGPAEQAEMKEILIQNRPYLNEEALEKHTADFEASFQKEKKFILLKYKSDIYAFLSYYLKKEDQVYAGNFSLRSEIKDPIIGLSFLKNSLTQLRNEYEVVAEVNYSKKPELYNLYKKRLGFEKTGEIEDFKGSGDMYYQITLKKMSSQKE